jgi:hypothetical protein
MASFQAVCALNVVCSNWICVQRRISTSGTCWNSFSNFLSLSILFTLSSCQVPRDFLVSYLSVSFLLSLPVKFWEISLGVASVSSLVRDCTMNFPLTRRILSLFGSTESRSKRPCGPNVRKVGFIFFLNSWTLKIGPIGCPETSVRN